MIKTIFDNKIIRLVLSTILIVGTIFVVFTPDFLIIKWGANHAVKIMFAYLLIAMAFLAIDQKKLMLLAFICCSAIAVFLKNTTSSEMKAPEKTQDAVSIKVAHFNVNNANEDFISAIETILSTKADLLSFQEVTPIMDGRLSAVLDSIYPYHYSNPGLGLFGMALFSKYPYEYVDTFQYKEIPNIIGCIAFDEENKVHFVSSHTLPALNNSYYIRLKEHLDKIADYCNELNEPILAFGDYHTVPWSDEIQDFRIKTNLDDSRKGFTPTFPHGVSTIFEVPVDHIFFSPDFKCLGFSTVSTIYTNHLGIQGIFELQPKKEKDDKTKN